MHTDITIEDVKKVKGMENISDELAQEIVRSVVELSEILFHTTIQANPDNQSEISEDDSNDIIQLP